MKLEQLRYFAEVARTEHVGKAAKALHISPSCISHSISALEKELGRELFDRLGKNIVLTEWGKRLAVRAGDVFKLIATLEDEIRSDEVEPSGEFRIVATHGFLQHWIAPAWAKFQKKYPKMKVEFMSLRSAMVVDQVAAGRADLGFCFSPLAHPSIVAKVVRMEKLHIAVRKGHPILKLTTHKSVLSALAQLDFAMPKAFTGIEVCEDLPALVAMGIKKPPSFLFDSYNTAGALIAQSDIWSPLPESFVQWFDLKTVDLSRFHAEVVVASLVPKFNPPSRALREFLALVEQT